MPIRNLFKDKKVRIGIAMFFTISIAILSLVKLGKVPVPVKGIDKLEHALAYFVLTMSWLFALVKNKTQIYFIVVSCFIYGTGMEFLQELLTEYRRGEFYDIVANSTGILLAFISYSLFFYKKTHYLKN